MHEDRPSPISANAADDAPVFFDERTIRRTARLRGPRGPATAIFLRRLVGEAIVRGQKRIGFRSERNEDACQAYRAMAVTDFAAVNALQSWANWRTIPRSLSGRLPHRPVMAVDLCCGSGDSTQVLAAYLPPGSRILGLEASDTLVAAARNRRYTRRDGETVDVTFRAQSVLEPFADAHGRPLGDREVDLVIATGAIGCHFRHNDVRQLAEECARVIRPGGLASLDSGHSIRADDLTAIFASHGFTAAGRTRSSIFDRYTQVCLRKPRTEGNDAARKQQEWPS